MSSDPSQKENNLQFLDSDWKLATVYTAFLVPKSHQDAVRLIYGLEYDRNRKAPSIPHAQGWISTARDQLLERNLLSFIDNKVKSSIIKASVDPIIQSLMETNKEMMKDLSVLEGVRLVLDSQWFRNFFTFQNIYTPMTYTDGTVYEPYRNLIKIIKEDRSKKLEIRSLQNRLFQLLYEIGYYCHNVRYLVNDFKIRDRFSRGDMNEDPIFDELLQEKNFDLFLMKRQHDIDSHFIEIWKRCMKDSGIDSLDQAYSERLISRMLEERAGIFMPMQVAIALRSSPCTRSVQPVDCGYTRKRFIIEYGRVMREQGLLER